MVPQNNRTWGQGPVLRYALALAYEATRYVIVSEPADVLRRVLPCLDLEKPSALTAELMYSSTPSMNSPNVFTAARTRLSKPKTVQ